MLPHIRHAITLLVVVLCLLYPARAQEVSDPAFDPPFRPADAGGRKIRWNGTVGMVVINGKLYQQFGLRPDIPLGKWGLGLDLTVRLDADGRLKEDEWDEPLDALEKIYYIRYGAPGDPLYMRVGALDNVTLGHGIVVHRYNNTIQYPEVKRVGAFVDGAKGIMSFQGMTNNLRELDGPGVVATRIGVKPPVKLGVVFGVTLAADGNQYAGLIDDDDDGVPNRLDLFADRNDYLAAEELRSWLEEADIQELIQRGYLPDINHLPQSNKGLSDPVVVSGVDAGIPVFRAKGFSLWTYAQAAQIHDFGWGWSFPGARAAFKPIEIGVEYRHYEKQFIGDYFDFAYELERVQVVGDSTYATKESRLENLGEADGIYGDVTLSIADLGYLYAWALDMHGRDYIAGKTFYGEAAVTPPNISRLKKVAGYFFQPNQEEFFSELDDGTVYGGKLFVGLSQNVTLVYDHRVSYANGEQYRTVRIETMITF